MSPLAFVNWRELHIRFCLVMWLLAGALAIVILSHTGDASAGHHVTAATARGAIR